MRGLSETRRLPLVRSWVEVVIANVGRPDRRWPLPLVLPGSRPCPWCGHVPDNAFAVLAPETPTLN